MTKARKSKNITINLTADEVEDFEYVVDYFQQRSIANVSKSLVIKFMIGQMKETIKKNQLENVRKLLDKVEENPEFDLDNVELGQDMESPKIKNDSPTVNSPKH
ncbi:hypothetical protein [Bacillus altitudinis]|uniref:hypothetical protein n=1 Tax=Bacillus altitudinis TaxID=293387 RepID=UPI002100B54B|nr:hypothetical protein [Bacillus altitudinis]UTV34839.1 hypothetical protein NM966_19795 [Bacillus altitudinis]